MLRRGKIIYWGGVAAVALLSLAAAVLLFPGLVGSGYIPQTAVSNIEHAGNLLEGGSFNGTTLASDVITLEAGTARGTYESNVEKTDYPFNAAGLHWTSSDPDGSRVRPEVRFSEDGVNWEDWKQVAYDELEAPDFDIERTRATGEKFGELAFTEKAEYLQYRLNVERNPDGTSPSISNVKAIYIDTRGYKESPLSLGKIISRAGALFKPSEAGADPSIISRAQWGANESLMTWTPEYATPKVEIVHHTVTSNNDPDPAATVRSIYVYHAVSNGWGDIGYNFLVDQQGRIYEGRYGGNGVIGGHALNWNTGSIGISVLGDYSVASPTSATLAGLVDVMSWKSNANYIDPLGWSYMNGAWVPNYLGHRDVNSTSCPGSYLHQHLPWLRSQARARYAPGPNIYNGAPSSEVVTNRPLIGADFTSASSIDPAAVIIKLDDVDVSAGATRTNNYVGYKPPLALSAGTHNVYVKVTDGYGYEDSVSWSFTVAAVNYEPRDYYWPWYDNVGGRNWILMANPVAGTTNLNFNVGIGGRNMDLSPHNITPGMTSAVSYANVVNGPVNAISNTGASAIVSQRTLWQNNSLEEVLGTDFEDLSDHYYWTWYDNLSPGITNWVLVANHNSTPVYFEIKVGGQLKSNGTIQAGGRVTPTFPGVMGGPVEVQAWTDSGKGTAADVIASQRVLSSNGAAFNEVPGIPAEELSDHYVWTWYDNVSPGATNWVLLANHNASPVYYEIKVAGQLVGSGTMQEGGRVTPTFPGVQGGPVEVQAWTDSSKTVLADFIASQRSIWGPSFEEVPGYPAGNLSSSFLWTWYDNNAPGVSNWVLVANHNSTPVYYETRVGGQLRSNGTIPAGGRVTPSFPGVMGGPVEVQAWTDAGKATPTNVMASQRVLWNGFFNEVEGAVISPTISNTVPTGETNNSRPLIGADISSAFNINSSSIEFKLDDNDVFAAAALTGNNISYRPASPLPSGVHNVYLKVTDGAGNEISASWSFSVAASSFTPRDYYWTWYDNVGGRNWVLMANPNTVAADRYFELAIDGHTMDLSPFTLYGTGCPGSSFCTAGQVPPGRTITSSFAGLTDGPVNAISLTGGRAVVSQRTLWQGSSLEEVLGTDAGDLSNHYYWTWYDQTIPGTTNWVLVANHNSFPVYYEIKVAGQLRSNGTIPVGGRVTPTFPGVMGGPVEVQAWTDAGKGTAADVIASQRVLSSNGTAFNEVPGIPAEKLSDHYVWTWYDNVSGRNWILIANPNPGQVGYQVKIAGQTVQSGTIQGGGQVTALFARVGGPVEVISTGGNVIASQRSLWGPSFEEVTGYPWSSIEPNYFWTWYDNTAAGATNWVLVANPNPEAVYYEIKVGGQVKSYGTIPAGGRVTPTFPGVMGGPVEVHAWSGPGTGATPKDIIASQRVLWNGFFNEVEGTVLGDEGNAEPSMPSGPNATLTADSAYEVRDGNGTLLTSLNAADTATVTYSGGYYYVQTSTGYSNVGTAYVRAAPTSASGIMQVTSYHDIPAWNPSLDDNRFRGAIEVRYSPVSSSVWVVNDLLMEDYMKGIAETSSGSPAEYLKTMTVAARSYALWHFNNGGKHGSSEIFHLKNSRNGNGDDQQYKGYGLEARFPDLVTAVGNTTGQVVTYGGNVAITPYFSSTDGRTRSAQEAWGITYWPWLVSVPDPDCNGMTLNGHGVGLSGVGALARAGRGDGYQTILTYYYTGTAVQAVDTNRNIRIAIAPLS